jgi:biopolymer transport protein ExbD
MLSQKAKRMEQHHNRRTPGGLNLISLMDIFTILVFFLLVNSQDVEVLPNAKDVELPNSYSEQKAREAVVVLITDEQVLVQGKPVAPMDDVRASAEIVIPALEAELRQQTNKLLRTETDAEIADREVTIMADKSMPYRVLKKVMATASAAEYGKISLAVMQEAPEADAMLAKTN